MTPLGHGAVGYTASLVHPQLRCVGLVVALVVGSLLPDVDFLLVWAPNFNEWHRVVTHNLCFVFAAGVVATGVAPRATAASPLLVGLAVVFGGVLHLVVDSVMDGNPSNGIGVAYLWPFVEQTYSPFNLVEVTTDPPTWRELDRMIPAVLRGVVFEAPFYVAALGLYFRRRTKE